MYEFIYLLSYFPQILKHIEATGDWNCCLNIRNVECVMCIIVRLWNTTCIQYTWSLIIITDDHILFHQIFSSTNPFYFYFSALNHVLNHAERVCRNICHIKNYNSDEKKMNNGIAHVFAKKLFDEIPSLYAFTVLRTNEYIRIKNEWTILKKKFLECLGTHI